MWFGRKFKNRRLRREYVLDVKLRSSQVRAARTRMAAVALGIIFALVFGVYLLWQGGQAVLNYLVYENKVFSVDAVEVETDGVISPDQLRRWAGVKAGENLLALDLTRVKRDLEMITLVQSASVERMLPRTLRIRIVEREPVAQVHLLRPRTGGGFEPCIFFLDAEGWVVLPLQPGERNGAFKEQFAQLPFITGIPTTEVQAGRKIQTPQLQSALELIAAFDRSTMAGLVELRKIDVATPEVLVATTAQGSEVTFSLADFDQQLRRWHGVSEAGRKIGRAIASLDLAITNNVPARWLEASAAPPPAPKPLKPYKNKRKNV